MKAVSIIACVCVVAALSVVGLMRSDAGAGESVVPQEAQKPDVVPEGIHIMTDGTIMAGDGTALNDATILPDGRVLLSNGVIVDEVADMRAQPASEAVSGTGMAREVSFDVVGKNMEFDLKQIKVQRGDIVTINFRNEEGFHDWVIDEFDAATPRINEGGEAAVTFVADTPGTFQYYCSVGSHRRLGMVGYLIVE